MVTVIDETMLCNWNILRKYNLNVLAPKYANMWGDGCSFTRWWGSFHNVLCISNYHNVPFKFLNFLCQLCCNKAGIKDKQIN